MSENMPEKQNASAGSSFAARAAAVALGISGALLLALYLVATLPEKSRDWRAALPTPAMAEKDAEAASLRARYLHEAAVRPQLIQAGFFGPGDAGDEGGGSSRHYRDDRAASLSGLLVRGLWTMRTLPELHDAFLAMLLEEKTGPAERAEKFFQYAGFLASAAKSIALDRAADTFRPRGKFRLDDPYLLSEIQQEWFAYFADGPRVKRRGRGVNDPDETYEAKLALAREVLPPVLRSLVAEMDERTAQAAAMAAETSGETGKGRKSNAWGRRHSAEDYLGDISHDVSEAMAAIWKNHETPGFLPQALAMIASKEAAFEQRYSAISLIAKKPGLSAAEYAFWQRYKSDLASVTGCLGTSPASYAYLLGCMDKLMTATTDMMKARGTIILSGQEGPGVTMTRTREFTPRKNLSGGLYLLADMALAMKDAPAYDLSRAFPIFRGMLYRHMENQPLVLPLNPQTPGDKALLDWYNAKGWATGRMLLFSAVGAPAEVAAHWGTLHLAWWDSGKKKAEPDLAFLHPVSGHFMTGLLPELKGKAASRFLGPVTGMWFGRRNVDKNGWVTEKYEARPEVMPVATPPARKTPLRSPTLDWLARDKSDKADKAETPKPAPAYSDATATILIDGALRKNLGEVYRHNYRVNMARRLETKFKDESVTPLDVFTFADNAVTMLAEWGITGGKEVTPATEYLWQYRNAPEIEIRIRDILSDDSLRPYERLRKTRRTLGLPEKKGS